MKIVIPSALICYSFIISAITINAQHSQTNPRADVSVSTGIMSDNLSWSIAGNLNGTNPNIYSELIWKKILAAQVEVDIRYWLKKRFIASATVSRSFVFSGSATDSDYEMDNRTSRTFFAELDSRKGMSYALRPEIGYQIRLSDHLHLIPGIGYGWASQKFYLLDDGGLNSTYHSYWKGPVGLIGVESKLKRILADVNIRYNQVVYDAQADWNLVESFQHPVSFEHRAKGYGLEADLVVGYKLNNAITLFLKTKSWQWTTGLGIDELYLKDGTVEKTRLNDVTRNGNAVHLGVICSFRSRTALNSAE